MPPFLLPEMENGYMFTLNYRGPSRIVVVPQPILLEVFMGADQNL